MKYLLALLLTIPLLGKAQDCKVKKETDQFSQQPRLSTGFINLSSTAGRVALNMVADSKEIKFLFSMAEGVCFDDQSTAYFSFDSNKTKSMQRNTTAMNCDGIFTVVFRNATSTPSVLQKITLQKISSIVLTDNTKKKMEVHLSADQKQQVLDKAACLVKEAKTLIK